MTTNTNNKLTDEQLQEIYGEAVSCELAEKNGAYMACFDLLCKMDDVGGTAHVVRKLIDMLRAEWVELQELRRNYLALRGEIEDVQSQLYEAENQANEYASELQERRKADNQEPAGYHVIKECGRVGCSVATLEEAEKTRDFWNKKWTIRPYFYSAALAPVVPEEMPAGLAGQIVSLLAHNIGDKFLAQKIWNACRAAMLQGKGE